MSDTARRDAIPHIAALMSKIDIFLFATRGNDGELHARPMSNNGQVEWDGRSWFLAQSDGRLVSELRSDPAAVAADRAEEGFTFVSVSGTATLETDAELKERYWLDELERWFPNGPVDPNVTLIRLHAERAQWWTAEGDGTADLLEPRETA
jgi:general stress protein 26